MKENLGLKGIIVGIVLLLLCSNITLGITKNTNDNDCESFILNSDASVVEKTVPLTVSIYGMTGIEKHTVEVAFHDAVLIADLCTALRGSMVVDPGGERTRQLCGRFLDLLEESHAIPAGVSYQELCSFLQPPVLPSYMLPAGKLPFQNKASEWFCNFATFGQGSAFPIIILPRFIPFLLTPIPRVFVYWSTDQGITSVGGLVSGTGFVAGGAQQGIALGFWGIGFSVFLPPIRSYGLFGYAIFTRVKAEQFEFYPPNNPPVITQTDPVDGQQFVSLSTTELRFAIEDADEDLMSFSVTTEPDIGSGSGGLKPEGTYSIPISGLESFTTYRWYIQLTDGKDTVNTVCSFTTEPTAPIVSNPVPADGERDIPIDLTQLKFTIKDFQGDAMSYTVETSPRIGSGSGNGVHNGTYDVPVSGLAIATTYRWYLNVTDGLHWTRKIFAFETEYPSQFNPFDYGWHYRKQITIDHTQVLDDLANFPVLLSTMDADLYQKAQVDGGDVMFMNDVGVSTRLYHDLESYDSSSGSLVTWVNIPFLSSANDTVFYMYYGNPSCINQAYPEKTWDTTYEAVWHMNDATPMTIFDSTSNQYVGTKQAPNEPQGASGKISTGQDFDGINDHIQFTHSIIPLGAKTISAWINRHSIGWYGVVLASSTGISSSDAGTSWSLIGINNTLQCVLGNGQDGGHYMKVYVTHAPINSWHYYTMTYDETTLRVYIDGQLAGSTTTKSGYEQNPTHALRMGETSDPRYDYYLDAGLDEIQISNVARSDAWIQTSYAMMMDPSQFLTIGLELQGP